MKRNGSDILIDCLIAWGVDTIFGLPGDGINGLMEAIRKRQDRIRFIQVRHEESAALMACAHSKWTGRIGCCLATTGPGGVHLLNGLYDAKFDKAAVIAVTGLPYHDLIDTFTQQDVDLPKLFSDVAAYSSRIMSAAHVENATSLACRIACTQHTVAHVAIPTDVQEEELDEVEPSTRNVQHHVSFAHQEGERVPEEPELARAIEILNRGKRVAILAGHGALKARDELLEVAELLGAPIVKALLGKAVVPDDHPLCIGGIGLLGTRPSQEAFEECDTLLIVGSTFPYVEYYPKPGQARGVQIDRDASRIGLRFPVEVGLVGDARKTLAMLAKRLKAHGDRTFLERCQRRKLDWKTLLECSADNGTGRLAPGKLARELGQRLHEDALVAWDSGHNTGVLARYVNARGSQQFAGSGMLATMACSLSVCHRRGAGFSGAAGGGLHRRRRPLDVDRRAGHHRALPTAHQDRGDEEQLAGPDQVGAAHVPGQSRIRVRSHAHRFRARGRRVRHRQFPHRHAGELRRGARRRAVAGRPRAGRSGGGSLRTAVAGQAHREIRQEPGKGFEIRHARRRRGFARRWSASPRARSYRIGIPTRPSR